MGHGIAFKRVFIFVSLSLGDVCNSVSTAGKSGISAFQDFRQQSNIKTIFLYFVVAYMEIEQAICEEVWSLMRTREKNSQFSTSSVSNSLYYNFWHVNKRQGLTTVSGWISRFPWACVNSKKWVFWSFWETFKVFIQTLEFSRIFKFFSAALGFSRGFSAALRVFRPKIVFHYQYIHCFISTNIIT